jgi:uncharacterized protein (DUF1015 family)
MAEIKPFKAVRPRRDLAHLVASRPVSTYQSSILEAKLIENPFTFIHIIHPEFFEGEQDKTEPNTPERFQKVRSAYEDFLEKDLFIEEKEEALYLYRQTTPKHCFTGIIGGSSIEEYNNDLIKKHEATLTNREEMFTNYLDIVGINAEPVLLSHEFDSNIDALYQKTTEKRPEYEFTTTDCIKHELWVVIGQQKEELIESFKSVSATYIADGHHRSASSARLAERINLRNGGYKEGMHNHFLTYLISNKDLEILPFDRISKTLNGLTKDEFLSKIKEKFEIKELDRTATPKKLHTFHCYIDGQWFDLHLKEAFIPKTGAVERIDAHLLTQHVLDPILNIKDLKTDKNISFLGGENTAAKIEQAVDSGVYQVGFALHPVTFDQLKGVADNNEIMPPKSTWIIPKLRSGLIIYNIKNG